jgi:flagellar biosynthesis/type III secretory pathway chaperone
LTAQYKSPARLPPSNSPFESNRPMTVSWESELAQLLTELSEVQSDLLELLLEKQQLLRTANTAGLADMVPREQVITGRLQACHDRRATLLAQANDEGMPSDSLRSLAGALPRQQRMAIAPQVDAAASRARILRHHSLTNWVVVQRSLLHLTRMIEIIATGGRLQPTYGKGDATHSGGSMLDQAA